MTHDTDALVREVRALLDDPTQGYSTPLPMQQSHKAQYWEKYGPQLCDAIDRLTRERDEAKSAEKSANGWYAKLERECQEVRRSLKEAEAALSAAREEAERFKKLDREAATHVESLICVRTHFTGEPPYVGWKGLGLALREALDAGDAARAELASLKEALTPSADTKADYIGEFHFTRPAIDEDGDEFYERITVPWDTTKQIMAAILNRALKEAPHE